MTVVIAGVSYECTKAVKGPNFVHLYQGDLVILSCLGVSDFSDYILTDGEWSDPDPDPDVIADSVEVVDGIIRITSNKIIGTGTLLKFKAPCGCDEFNGNLKINEKHYTVLDAGGLWVGGKEGMWNAGMLVSFLIDDVDGCAIIQNGAKPTDTLDIKDGGTGATTAEEARANLGAAKAQHTHSPADLTGPIPIEKGGTGATTAEEARANLGACRIYTFTYTGTGEGGKDNPTQIQFPFAPALVVIRDDGDGYQAVINTHNMPTTKGYEDVVYYSVPATSIGTDPEDTPAYCAALFCRMNLSRMLLYLYSYSPTTPEEYQFNKKGTTYSVVAFG